MNCYEIEDDHPLVFSKWVWFSPGQPWPDLALTVTQTQLPPFPPRESVKSPWGLQPHRVPVETPVVLVQLLAALVSLEWEAFPVPSCWGHGPSHQGHSQGQELLTPALQELSSPPRSWPQQSSPFSPSLCLLLPLSFVCPSPFLLTSVARWSKLVSLAQKPLRQQISRQSPLESMLNMDPWAHSQGSGSSGLGWNLRICIASKVPGDAQESGPHCNSIIPNGGNKIPSFPSLQKCRHREGVRYGKLQDCWNTNKYFHSFPCHPPSPVEW